MPRGDLSPLRQVRRLPRAGSARDPLRWWREARFGLFIHWGLYAIPAGVWRGERVPGIGEWLMFSRKIPVAEYERLAARFHPRHFDAAAIVRLALNAGQRYLVITAKHHEGFAMFRSAASPYNVVDATPWRRHSRARSASGSWCQGVASTTLYGLAAERNIANPSWCLAVMTR